MFIELSRGRLRSSLLLLVVLFSFASFLPFQSVVFTRFCCFPSLVLCVRVCLRATRHPSPILSSFSSSLFSCCDSHHSSLDWLISTATATDLLQAEQQGEQLQQTSRQHAEHGGANTSEALVASEEADSASKKKKKTEPAKQSTSKRQATRMAQRREAAAPTAGQEGQAALLPAPGNSHSLRRRCLDFAS